MAPRKCLRATLLNVALDYIYSQINVSSSLNRMFIVNKRTDVYVTGKGDWVLMALHWKPETIQNVSKQDMRNTPV